MVCKVGPAKKAEKVRKARLATKAKKTSKVSLTLGVGQPGARLFFSLSSTVVDRCPRHFLQHNNVNQ